MLKIYDRLYIGDQADCTRGNSSLAVVHACKSPCHQDAVGYKGSLPPDHPNYLYLRDGWDLYLNLVDPPVPLFKPESFKIFLDFATEHYGQGRTVLIHCNKMNSRAPSLAMLFLARGAGTIPNESYEAAMVGMMEFCPLFIPGKGIETYMRENWRTLGQ